MESFVELALWSLAFYVLNGVICDQEFLVVLSSEMVAGHLGEI